MSNVFTFRMPVGVPGTINRAAQATVEAAILDATNPPTSYGVPVAFDGTSHNLRKIIGGDAAAAIVGFYPRPYPTNNNTDGLGTSTPPTSGIGQVMRRGYMLSKLNVGTAVKGGTVYVRITANGGNTIIGGIEATADGANTITMANAMFTGGADGLGTVEVAFNL